VVLVISHRQVNAARRAANPGRASTSADFRLASAEWTRKGRSKINGALMQKAAA